jgi:aminoglycoside phosphotransferase (APT) family kinase protein
MDRDDIDAALARRLISRQFPQWADLPVSPVALDGWDNRTFRLGAELSIRLPTGEWYAKQVEKEQRWLPALACPRWRRSCRCRSRRRWREASRAPTSRTRGRSMAGWTAGRPQACRWARPWSSPAPWARSCARSGADATGAPPPGEHNFFRGGPLATYEAETHEAIAALGAEIPREAVERVWDEAMSTTWDRDPVWIHGDVAVGNLLLRDGRLSAVIDFGCSGVGDPACDMVIAWTFLSGEARDRFRAELGVDDATWSRGRGWCLWKALITLVGHLEAGSSDAALSRRDIEQVLADRGP